MSAYFVMIREQTAVILEFPDMAAARAWYDSPSYQAAFKFRHAGSKSKAFFIEGV
jgi:uncharacterized protein (DUF1330 family)